MKNGRDRTPLTERLGERLNAQTSARQEAQAQVERQNEQLVDQAADSMQSALKSFESDCAKSLNAAKRTIENDMADLIAMSDSMKRSVKPIWATAMTTSVVVVLLSLIASWYWATTLINRAQRASLWQMGLTLHQTQSGQYLTWDKSRVTLLNCQSGKEQKPCLKLSEGD